MKQDIVDGVKKSVRTGRRFLNKNSAKIFFWIGTAGMCLSVVSAIHDTPKAVRIYDEMKKKNKEPKPIDVVKSTWKCYIPTASMAAVSLACLIFSDRKYTSEGASLAAAYALSESTFAEYRKKVYDKFGKKKANDVQDEIVEDKIKSDPPDDSRIIVTGIEDQLFYEPISKQYFKSSIVKIERGVNALNRLLLLDDTASLNDLYYEINLPNTDVGERIGWNVWKLGKEGVKIRFTPILDEEKGMIVTGVSFVDPPWHGYDK